MHLPFLPISFPAIFIYFPRPGVVFPYAIAISLLAPSYANWTRSRVYLWFIVSSSKVHFGVFCAQTSTGPRLVTELAAFYAIRSVYQLSLIMLSICMHQWSSTSLKLHCAIVQHLICVHSIIYRLQVFIRIGACRSYADTCSFSRHAFAIFCKLSAFFVLCYSIYTVTPPTESYAIYLYASSSASYTRLYFSSTSPMQFAIHRF